MTHEETARSVAFGCVLQHHNHATGACEDCIAAALIASAAHRDVLMEQGEAIARERDRLRTQLAASEAAQRRGECANGHAYGRYDSMCRVCSLEAAYDDLKTERDKFADDWLAEQQAHTATAAERDEERRMRVQLSDDSQRHLDRALAAERRLAQARAALEAAAESLSNCAKLWQAADRAELAEIINAHANLAADAARHLLAAPEGPKPESVERGTLDPEKG